MCRRRSSFPAPLILAVIVIVWLPPFALPARPMAEDLPAMTVTDALGREVLMPRPAERIAGPGPTSRATTENPGKGAIRCRRPACPVRSRQSP